MSMNPVLACIYRRDVSALRRLLGGFEPTSHLSQEDLDEGLRVVVGDTDTKDVHWKNARNEVATMLLTAGANRDLYIGDYPLVSHTLFHGDVEMTMMLLYQFTSNIDAKNKDDGKTPLHVAVCRGREDMVNMLLSVGANASAVDNYGHTPLHTLITVLSRCSEHGDGDSGVDCDTLLKIFHLLLPLTDIKITNRDGSTVIHTAIRLDTPAEVISNLVQAGADFNKRDHAGQLPLCEACRCANIEALEVLLDAGCDTNLTCSGGHTALHFAASFSNHDNGGAFVQRLLKSSACVDVMNKKGQLPLHAAVALGNAAATQALIMANCSFINFGNIVYNKELKILTIDNNKLCCFSLDNYRRYWNHIDFVELAMLVTAGCALDTKMDTIKIVRDMATDVNTGKPGNWRNSLYGIKNGYNLQTLFLAAELLHVYAVKVPSLKHLSRLSVRHILGIVNGKDGKYVLISTLVKKLGLPELLIDYVLLTEFQGFQLSTQNT